ncbi:single-stranded DNA-binding protein [Weissella tructae]|uniref:single-stranded DNA-binding protein n=1 Tax=Weissella tructae TaxID=887702 RepID=UPI003D94877C
MINRVVLVGRLTRELELKYTTSGAAVATFSIAVNRQFTNANGEREADFINCVIWRKAAENMANFTTKGSQVAIEGKLQTRNYENQQGQRVYVTEVNVDNFSLLDSRADTEQRQQSNRNAAPQQSSGNVFGEGQQNVGQHQGTFNPSERFGGNSSVSDSFGGTDVSTAPDDDVPF